MLKTEDNELLTRVGPGTPMGDMLRQYWVPAIRSSALEAGGAPVRVRLFAQDFVAFRSPGGEVGFTLEACPHRGVSLALARNESFGLQCIFHGWKLNRNGRVIDAPNEPAKHRAKFVESLRYAPCHAREAGGVLWVYVGKGDPPPFPDWEFNNLPPERVLMRRGVVHYNWLQAVEAHLDSSHVAFLHAGPVQSGGPVMPRIERAELAKYAPQGVAPTFELEETEYGLQESALRAVGDDRIYARVREIVLPFYIFIPGVPNAHCDARISVPIDDYTTAEWYIVYDPAKPLDPDAARARFLNTSDDPDDFAANLGNRENNWHQDRAAMKTGYWSGIVRNLSFEDFVVQASMGSMADRSNEQLGTADMIVVTARRMLLNAVRNFKERNEVPWNSARIDYREIRAQSFVYTQHSDDWRRYLDHVQDNSQRFGSPSTQPREEV